MKYRKKTDIKTLDKGVLYILKSLFDPLTLSCRYSKQLFHYSANIIGVCLDNKKDIAGKRAVNPSLSEPRMFHIQTKNLPR